MKSAENILVVQTAFIGDVILTLPLLQFIKRLSPKCQIDFVVTPRAKDLCASHPAIREAIAFDKRGVDRGVRGLLRMVGRLRNRHYDLAIVPHRSLRSAALVWLLRIRHRIGFDRSAGRFLLTARVKYRKDLHEIERNLALLLGVGIEGAPRDLPRVYPSTADQRRVNKLLVELEVARPDRLVAIAPGTVWNTKRWLKERFASLAVKLDDEGFEIVLVGGKEDQRLCDEIRKLSGSPKVYSTAGKLTLLESAELVRRCKVIVCNDSAPMHLAVAVGTPVVAVFGATVPEFGFGPVGPHDAVVEMRGLKCRPCSIHGGDKCPIKTFECMNAVSYETVFGAVLHVLKESQRASINR